MELRVFISYSRKDKALVCPILELLRGLNLNVFRDEDSIAPGMLWEEHLVDELESATHVLVFWCRHAARSEWVQKEVELVSSDPHKLLIPVLIDDTPLPPALQAREYIDLRAALQRGHDSLRGRLGPWPVAMAAGASLMAVALTPFLLAHSIVTRFGTIDTATRPVGVPVPPTAEPWGPDPVVTLLIMAVLLAAGTGAWLLLRRERRRRARVAAQALADEYARLVGELG